MSGNQDINCSLICAVRKGRLERAMELINLYGLSYSKEWAEGYVLLRDAVRNRHTAIAKLLLTSGSRVNSKSKIPSDTPLHFAVINGDMEIVQMILDRGAFINAENKMGRSPLHNAIQYKKINVIELLLTYGIGVNATDNDGISILHSAVHTGDIEIVKIILDNGAHVNPKNRGGRTPLHDATKYRNIEVIELLLKHGADVNCLCTSTWQTSYTPLQFAAEKGFNEVIPSLLRSGGNVDFKGEDGITPLHIAIKYQHKTTVELLLQHGAKVDNQDKDGKTTLHLAVDKGCLTIVEDVLKYYPDITHQSNRSALQVAVQGYGEQYKKIVEALLEYGLIVMPEDANNPKLLHAAVEKGYLKIIEDLIKYGAGVNTLYNSTLTPLHTAAKNKREEVAKLLISYEADINAKDKTGKTPIFYAIENADLKITKLLLTNKANIKDSPDLLNIAITKECIEMVEALLQHGADINASDKCGRTALHFTTTSEDEFFVGSPDNKGEIAELLLSKGANVDAQTKRGETTLETAVQKGYAKVVKALLKYNANVNGVQRDITPLHVSVQRGYENITTMLLHKGANVNAKQNDGLTALHIAKDKTGKTPIFYAIENADLKITKLLLTNKANIKDSPDLLNIAITKECIEIVEALLQHGADINASDKYGRTALHFTALSEYGFFVGSPDNKGEIAELLLSKGANVDAQTKRGETTLETAVQKGYAKVVKALLKYNANVNGVQRDITPLHVSVQRGYENITTMLLHKGANVNAKQNDGLTALHIAALKGHKEVVKVLIECGAKVDSKMKKDFTPLHLSAERGHHETIETILKFGASIDCRDEYGGTALHIASRERHIEAVRTLLEYGSDINITTSNNLTPFDHAMAGINAFKTYDSGVFRGEVVADILERHIVKMILANLYVSEKNVQSVDQICYFQDECEEEIASMKSEKINNSNISFYDILGKSSSSLAIYMRNENIVQVLESDDYKTKFPIYFSMIKCNFRKGMERKELLEQGNTILHFLFNNFPELPYECTEKIFSYLSNEDLHILMDACKPLVSF